MSLTRWEPFTEIERLRESISHLFDRLAEHSTKMPAIGLGFPFLPPVEIKENPTTIELRLEVPGLEAKDLNIEASPASILIKGERKSESTKEAGGYTHSEFSYGVFERLIPLPGLIHTDKVESDFKNGILHLTMPKLDPAEHKTVKVQLS